MAAIRELTLRRWGANSLWLLAGRLGVQVLGLVFVALAARALGDVGFGQFALLSAVVLIGNAVTTFGADTLLIREVAQNGPATPVVSEALTLQLALSALWVGVVGAASLLLPVAHDLRLGLNLYNLALFPWAVITVCTSILRGRERMDLFVGVGLVSAAAQLAAVVAAVNTGLVGLTVSLTIAQGATAVVAWMLCARTFDTSELPRSTSVGAVIALMRRAGPMALIVAAALFSQRLPLFVLALFDGDSETGLYAAAARVLEGLKLLQYAAFGALLPAAARQANAPASAGAPPVAAKAFALTFGLSVVCALFVTAAAQPVVTTVFGNQFLASMSLLQVLVWALLPHTVSAYLSVVLVAGRHERVLAWVTLLSLVIGAVVYVTVHWLWQGLGLVMAVVAVECWQAGLLVWVVRRLRAGNNRMGAMRRD